MWSVRNAELGSKELAKFLSEGYEPYAVTHLHVFMAPMIHVRKKV